MKKLALVAIAAASIFSPSAAYAGWFDTYGYYHPTCGWYAWNQEESQQAPVQQHDGDGKRNRSGGETSTQAPKVVNITATNSEPQNSGGSQ